MALKTQKNLISKKSEYNGYYGDFRGVDFSSDHTQVHNSRFAYLCNMYKDYRSKQGAAVETIPGYRMGFSAGTEGDEIRAIHHFEDRVLVHCGSSLYVWKDYPISCGVEHSAWVELVDFFGKRGELNGFTLDLADIAESNGGQAGKTAKIVSIKNIKGDSLGTFEDYREHLGEGKWVLYSSCEKGDLVLVSYYEATPRKIYDSNRQELGIGLKTISVGTESKKLLIDVEYPDHPGRLYLMEKNQNAYGEEDISISEIKEDDEKLVTIPITNRGIIQDGVNANTGEKYQDINIITPYFKNSFVGSSNENQTLRLTLPAETIKHIRVFREGGTLSYAGAVHDELRFDANSPGVKFDKDKNTVTIENLSVDEKTTIIVCAKRAESGWKYVASNTIALFHDNRIFLSGSYLNPNRIIFSKSSSENDGNDIFPLYFGEKDWVSAGISGSVSGLASAGKSLVALKKGSYEEDGVYLFNGLLTEDDVVARTYQKVQGLNGVECYGACKNFRDDTVFLTKNGLDALGQVSISYDRALEHRSSLVDKKLCEMNFKNAVMTQFDGYLAIFVDGCVFLADSRQRYKDTNGVLQYEWYYLEDVGWYKGQYEAFKYANETNLIGSTEDDYMLELAPEDKRGDIANTGQSIVIKTGPITNGGKIEGYSYYVVEDDADGKKHAYVCDNTGIYIGGEFVPASSAETIGDNLVFSAGNNIFQFNFDKRENGEIAPKWYTFNGRTIVSGCATKMDNCGIPHLTKSTVKKSMVAKIKSMLRSTVKVKVRTNKIPYEQIDRINSALFSFEMMDFDDYTFSLDNSGLFCVKEKEKKWVEKQIYLYSDEFMRPFAVYYLAFRYTIAGKFKD